MTAAVIHFIRFTATPKGMMSNRAGRRNARFIDTVSRLPALNLICAFDPMVTAMIHAVFLTYYIIVVFIRFTLGRTATAFKTRVSGFAYFVILAVFISAAIMVGSAWIDTSITAFDKAFGFTCIILLRIIGAMPCLTYLLTSANFVILAVFISTAELYGCGGIDA